MRGRYDEISLAEAHEICAQRIAEALDNADDRKRWSLHKDASFPSRLATRCESSSLSTGSRRGHDQAGLASFER
jgi:hypothetical protein